MARLRDCASVERSSTSLLNTPGGGPAIDSNAMVGPTPVLAMSETLDVVLSVVQPEASAPISTHTKRARAAARLCPDRTTRAPPCDQTSRFLPTSSPADLELAPNREAVQRAYFTSGPILTFASLCGGLFCEC